MAAQQIDYLNFDKVCAVDTETTGLDIYREDYCTDMSWANNDGKSDVLSVESPRFLTFGNWLCSNPDILKVFWNASFDIPVLKRAGIKVIEPYVDAMLLARLLHTKERTVNLKHMSRKFLNDTFEEDKRMKEWLKRNKDKREGQAPDRIRIPYARKDAENTLLLWMLMIQDADEDTLGVFRTEMAVQPATQAMQERGLKLDVAQAVETRRRAVASRQKVLRKLRRLTHKEFNPNSHPQVRKVIYDGTTKVRFYTDSRKPQPSTSALALHASGHRLAPGILRFREWHKLVRTYLDAFLTASGSDGVIHPSFNQAGTRTGRYSSSDPNFQNLPRPGESPLGHVKDLVIARSGFRLVLIDYEQLEIRVAAHYSQQDHLCDAILHGKDIHSETCKAVFDKKESSPDWNDYRFYAKTFNFAIQYGAGAQKLQHSILDMTGRWIPLHVVQHLRDTYVARNPDLVGLFDSTGAEVARTGKVKNCYGRAIAVPRNEPYKAVNYLIQSTAADLIKDKMPEAFKILSGYKSGLVLQVHDELGFEIHQSERHLISEIHTVMEEHDRFVVPMTCDVKYGKRWGRKKPYPRTPS
jgi:DNA polymerase-1